MRYFFKRIVKIAKFWGLPQTTAGSFELFSSRLDLFCMKSDRIQVFGIRLIPFWISSLWSSTPVSLLI